MNSYYRKEYIQAVAELRKLRWDATVTVVYIELASAGCTHKCLASPKIQQG